MALPPPTQPYTPVILSSLTGALARNNVTPLGRQLTINPSFITNPVTQDTAPYTCNSVRWLIINFIRLNLACVFPFALNLIDYNFCIPLAPNFICSQSRVIDRNTTLNSLDCSRNRSYQNWSMMFYTCRCSSIFIRTEKSLFSQYLSQRWNMHNHW
jgi:hypothetical protein